MATLDAAGLPYVVVPGNHDYGERGLCQDRSTGLSDWFGVPPGATTFEPGRIENSFLVVEAGGRRFLVLGLEFGPRREVVRWAGEVVEEHPGHEVVLVTHAFVYGDDERYDWAAHGTAQLWSPQSYPFARAAPGDVCDGETLWRELVAAHDRFVLVVGGHVLNDGVGLVVTATPGGRRVPQMLVNHQMRPRGGDGWLRLLELRPDRSLQTWEYSPVRGQCNAAPRHHFRVELPACEAPRGTITTRPPTSRPSPAASRCCRRGR